MRATAISVSMKVNNCVQSIPLQDYNISTGLIKTGNTLIVYYDNEIYYYRITRADFYPAQGLGNNVFSITVSPSNIIEPGDVTFIELKKNNSWFKINL